MKRAETGIEEFVVTRTRRLSIAFIGVLGVSLLVLGPVFFFVVRNHAAGYGAVAGIAICLISLFLVRRGMARVGNALFFGACLLIVAGVAWVSHGSGEGFAVVLVSVVGLSLVVLIPVGILVTPPVAAIYAGGIFILLLPSMILSGDTSIMRRVPVFLVVYLFAGAINFSMSRIQDSLLRKALAESVRSNQALESVREMLRRVDALRLRVDESQRLIGEQLDQISEIVGTYTTRVIDVAGSYGEVAVSVAKSHEELGRLDDSVRVITTNVRSQSDLVKSTFSAQERISYALTSMGDQIQSADATNAILASSAQSGRENVKLLLGVIDELKDYQKRLAVANQTVQRIAAQTNILAMNASIEAAHAGDAGSGFSVVANEVRVLSDESNARTKEISSLIRGMTAAIGRGVETIGKTGDSLLEVDHRAELSRPILRELSEGMTTNLAALAAIADDSRSIVRSAAEIGESASIQEQVFGTYRTTFRALSDRLNGAVARLQGLESESERARMVISTLGRIREENEKMNIRIAEILGSKEN
ncbi:MAG TPA: methyl-accepting chemotaxis protein [Spirochaetia bacterium]|nr:methyl-accepting chemotaxis protein [Spirochaetia bacterium]